MTTAGASRWTCTKTEGVSAAEVVLTRLHAGAKFSNDSYKISGGLHGVGVSVVNALSIYLELEVRRDGGVYTQSYVRGVPNAPLEKVGKTKSRGTKVTFKPDDEIFEETEFSFDILSNRLRELAFLNSGVKITLIDERIDTQSEFFYKGGIVSFVEYINRNKKVLHKNPIFITGAREDCHGRGGPPVQRHLCGKYLFLCQQHQHDGGGNPPDRLPFRPDPGVQQLRRQQQHPEKREGIPQGRRSAGGAGLRDQRQDPQPPVRRADQDEAGQQRGQGARRGDRLRQDRQLSGRESRPSPSSSWASAWMRPGPGRRPGGPGS